MSLRILEPGLHTLIVDLGRPHCRGLGLPLGGAADRTSLMLGNALVGNPPGEAALECSLHGPTVQAECPLACVVYGAPFALHSDRQSLRVGTTFTLETGEALDIGGTTTGMRGYLCVAGGFDAMVVMASRSSLKSMEKGTVLPCRSARTPRRFVRIDWPWDRVSIETSASGQGEQHVVLRVIDGPQADWFHQDSLTHQTQCRVHPSSNRMGIRLDCRPPLTVPEAHVLSEPVCPGTIQITRDGQCIILGVDGQTIGGYPKIAQVISADLDQLGQLRPGQEIDFQKVTLTEAERLYHAKQADVHKWLVRIRTAIGAIF